MKTRLQGLMNEVIGYGMGAAINRGLGIVIACIYPILLNRDEYGRLDVIFSIPALLTMVFLVSIDSTLARFYYEHEDPARRRRLVSTVFYAVMSLALPAAGGMLLLSRPLALWLYGDSQYVLYFRLVLVAIPFVMANGIQSALFRLDRRVRTFNLLAAANLLISALIGISSILIFRIGATGVLIGFAAGYMVSGIAGIALNRNKLSPVLALRQIPELMGFGLPLVISGTAFWLIGYLNRPILAHRVSADDLGLYAIATGGVNVLALTIGAFRNAWQPFAFSIMGQEGSANVYGRALTLFTAAGMVTATCMSLFAPQALLFLNIFTHKNWSGAAASVGPLAMGAIFSAMYFIVQTGIYIAGRTSVIAWTMGIAAAANILLNIALIPRFGIMGAAFATAFGHLIALLALYLVAQRIKPVPYQPGKLLTTGISAAAVIAMASSLRTGALAGDMLLELALLGSYAGFLLVARIFTFRDLRLFWSGIRSASGSLGNRFRGSREETHADSY